MVAHKDVEKLSELLAGVDHDRHCRRYQQGLTHTSPVDCDCFIRGIAELFSRLETRIERLTDPHLDPRDPDAYTTRGRWVYQVAEVLVRDVQDLGTTNAKLLEALEMALDVLENDYAPLEAIEQARAAIEEARK